MPMWSSYNIPKLRNKNFQFLGPTSHPCTDGVKFDVEESTDQPNFTPSVQYVVLAGQKNLKSPPE